MLTIGSSKRIFFEEQLIYVLNYGGNNFSCPYTHFSPLKPTHLTNKKCFPNLQLLLNLIRMNNKFTITPHSPHTRCALTCIQLCCHSKSIFCSYPVSYCFCTFLIVEPMTNH